MRTLSYSELPPVERITPPSFKSAVERKLADRFGLTPAYRKAALAQVKTGLAIVIGPAASGSRVDHRVCLSVSVEGRDDVPVLLDAWNFRVVGLVDDTARRAAEHGRNWDERFARVYNAVTAPIYGTVPEGLPPNIPFIHAAIREGLSDQQRKDSVRYPNRLTAHLVDTQENDPRIPATIFYDVTAGEIVGLRNIRETRNLLQAQAHDDRQKRRKFVRGLKGKGT